VGPYPLELIYFYVCISQTSVTVTKYLKETNEGREDLFWFLVSEVYSCWFHCFLLLQWGSATWW
jgi:hypothetical protein